MSKLLQELNQSVKYWYLPLLLGVMLIALGIYFLASPAVAYVTLTTIFSLSFLLSGISDTAFAILNRENLKGWGWHLVSGLLSLVMGIYLLSSPAISMILLSFVVGLTFMFRAFEIFGFSLELKRLNVPNWGWLLALSILGIIFSFILVANPIFAGISLITFTALSFISSGVASVMVSLALKKIKNRSQKVSQHLKEKFIALEKELEEELRNS